MKRVGAFVYAFCGNAMYAFNYSTPPQKILDLDSDHAPTNWRCVGNIGDAVLWGAVDVNMYGKINSRVPIAYSSPFSFALRATTVSAMNVESEPNVLFVAGANSNLYRISTTSGGDNTGLLARTQLIDLKNVYEIKGISIEFGAVLATGDSFNVILRNREGNLQTVNPTFAALGAVSRAFFPVTLKADQLDVGFQWNGGGTVRTKGVIIWGELKKDEF